MEEELAYYIRINADWNEESFIKMMRLIRNVMEDYSDDLYYHKTFVFYCTEIIRIVIGTISREEFCNSWSEGYTKESYKDFIVERINQLKLLQEDFIMTF
ncbi:hypothetical protein SAMN05661091_4915 [Paenibacillus uliginis N3/975]|uniref:Uncharacterized protein n=1 Tax=Paenibacillus uliginis N3/975 TaxID=1313296 RepID=A0A1X7HQK6_9BACL|nr:hypothetical protein [Paenibacillus uliginis]SMF90162.1 hypothetical protein SAMN05661091_4915 [Paenibacillus uliginis N3/975]